MTIPNRKRSVVLQKQKTRSKVSPENPPSRYPFRRRRSLLKKTKKGQRDEEENVASSSKKDINFQRILTFFGLANLHQYMKFENFQSKY